MKFLLVAVNAKYIHSNLGVYSLKAYADQYGDGTDCVEIEIGEYTINHQMDDILKDIYRRKPAVVGFSCYIWNIDCIMDIVRDLHKILPDTEIWLGGPEVSYNAGEILAAEPDVFGIMMGEGEETFARLVNWYARRESRALHADFFDADSLDAHTENSLEHMDGVAVRKPNGHMAVNSIRPVMDMSKIPFSYSDLTGFEHKIIYYESSRGCPFSCSYCLSSLDKTVRFRSLELVKKELAFFLANKVPQVKFVDRTFNCKKSHAMAIWEYITEHDNGITNFHFEISADLLDEEELELMSRMRPGLIQLEIGVQTTNPATISEIRRTMDLDRLKEVVARINGGRNIHQHLDLIAGLPYEDEKSFAKSFNEVYAMQPDQLQLGFLKVLKGSHMAEKAGEYGLIYRSLPPYEVLATRWLDYGAVLKLKAVEDMVEVYYNSGQFKTTLKELAEEFATPFIMFEELAEFYEQKKLLEISHNRLARYEILDQFVAEKGWDQKKMAHYQKLFLYDLYLRENLKSRPSFAGSQEAGKSQVRAFFAAEAENPRYLKGYEGYDSRQLIKMAHLEVFTDGEAVLFDYKNRDPLTHNATAIYIGDDLHR